VIKQASQAHHYLVIYDKHTQEPLDCGRAKRFASPGQRIVLHALERGCTRPGCTAPGYWSEVHHVDGWAADDGETNITKLTLACGPDNRLVEEGGWTTENVKTAAPNGSHHHTSTPAKRGSTTTTTPSSTWWIPRMRIRKTVTRQIFSRNYGWYGTPTARNTYSGGTSNARDRRGSRIRTSSGMASL
jgi:hypothetical protein